jgi:hypothetical protein
MFDERCMRSREVSDFRGHATRFSGENGRLTIPRKSIFSKGIVSRLPLLAYPQNGGTLAKVAVICESCNLIRLFLLSL